MEASANFTGSCLGIEFNIVKLKDNLYEAFLGFYEKPKNANGLPTSSCIAYRSWKQGELPFLRKGLHWFGWFVSVPTLKEAFDNVREVVNAYKERERNL